MLQSHEPNSIDVHVGRRVRLRRHSIGVTQQQLAAALGISFQQVQKYERGANRISASKLFEIGQALDAPISYFFEGLEARRPGAADLVIAERDRFEKVLVEPGGSALMAAFMKIGSRTLKRCLVDLAVAIAGDEEAPLSDRSAVELASIVVDE